MIEIKIGTSWSGRVHQVLQADLDRYWYVGAACRRDIAVSPIDVDNPPYSAAEERIRRRFDTDGTVRRSQVCLMCAGPIERAGLISG